MKCVADVDLASSLVHKSLREIRNNEAKPTTKPDDYGTTVAIPHAPLCGDRENDQSCRAVERERPHDHERTVVYRTGTVQYRCVGRRGHGRATNFW